MATAPLDWLKTGFLRSQSRFMRARLHADPMTTFIPLLEALTWAYAIDDHMRASTGIRVWYRHDDIVRAVRFVRNCVQHDFASALYQADGVAFPIQFPSTFKEWRWCPAMSLPNRRRKGGEPEYVKYLQDQPVRFTLASLACVFARIGS